jgi:hypothetical protein
VSQGVSGVPAIPPDLLSRSARTQEGYSAKAQKSLPMSGINRRWLKPPLQWKRPTAPHLGSFLQKTMTDQACSLPSRPEFNMCGRSQIVKIVQDFVTCESGTPSKGWWGGPSKASWEIGSARYLNAPYVCYCFE